MFAKMLVPVDGSQAALKAAGVAAEMARRFESRVTLLHVQQLPGGWLVAPGAVGMVASEAALAALEEAAQEAVRVARATLDLPADRVTELIVVGHPAETICRIAEEGAYELIVMGSRGLSEVSGFFLGSVSDKVSHHAPCPVLIVH